MFAKHHINYMKHSSFIMILKKMSTWVCFALTMSNDGMMIGWSFQIGVTWALVLSTGVCV